MLLTLPLSVYSVGFFSSSSLSSTGCFFQKSSTFKKMSTASYKGLCQTNKLQPTQREHSFGKQIFTPPHPPTTFLENGQHHMPIYTPYTLAETSPQRTVNYIPILFYSVPFVERFSCIQITVEPYLLHYAFLSGILSTLGHQAVCAPACEEDKNKT